MSSLVVGRALRPTSKAQPISSGINPDLHARAFTLLEVVVAVGIFAIAMVAVIGLFTPIAKSVGDLADAEAATRVAELVNTQLQSREALDVQAGTPFQSLAALLNTSTGKSNTLTLSDASTSYDVTKAKPPLLFASRDGMKIGLFGDAVWQNSNHDKFFEIALIRNESISPNDTTIDAVAPLIAYTARVRWPAFLPLAGSTTGAIQIGANPTGTVAFDNSQKQVLFFTGTVSR